MTLGAQVYSVRKYIQTTDDYGNTLKQLKALGYDTVQHAGVEITDAYLLRDLTQQAGLQQICPNLSNTLVLENPEKAIEYVRILGCNSIMLPYVPCDSMATLESFLAGWAPFEASLNKLQEAGIKLCYHNHAFDIAPMFGSDLSFVDYLLENKPDWQFILDVAWAQYAGVDTIAYIEKIGNRMNCIHFKDFTGGVNSKNSPVFCACGSGKVTLDIYAKKVKAMGIENVIVEQDNAQDYPEPFGQMAQSADALRKLF